MISLQEFNVEELTQLADPRYSHPADQAYSASVDLRKVAQSLDRPMLLAKAWAWGSTHLGDLGRLPTVMSLHPVVQASLSTVEPCPELNQVRSHYLYSFVLVAADLGNFTDALRAQREFTQLNAGSENLFFRVHDRILLALLTERMGDAAHANWLVEDACSDYVSSTGQQLPASVYNALMALKLSQFCRGSGLISDERAQQLLETGFEDGRRALAIASDARDRRGLAYIKCNLAELLVYRGEFETAQNYIDYAAGYFHEQNYWAINDWLLVTRAKLYNQSGRPKRALSAVRPLYQRYDYDGVLNGTRARRVAAQACQQLGDYRQAFEHMKRLEIAERRRTMSQLKVQSEIFMTRIEVEARAEHHRRAAEIDPLTKVGNRRRLHRAMTELLPDVETPQGRNFAIAIVDIDHFKRVNDEFGHAVGDSVLVAIAEILEKYTRSTDVVIRLGGEEFLLLFPDGDENSAYSAANKICDTISSTQFESLPPDWRVTVSIGLAASPPSDSVRLVRIADEAMYQAKRAGRNQVMRASELKSEIVTTVDISSRV